MRRALDTTLEPGLPRHRALQLWNSGLHRALTVASALTSEKQRWTRPKGRSAGSASECRTGPRLWLRLPLGSAGCCLGRMGIQVKADEASVLEQDSGRQKLTISLTIIHTGALGVWDIHGAIHGLHSVILTWSPKSRADESRPFCISSGWDGTEGPSEGSKRSRRSVRNESPVVKRTTWNTLEKHRTCIHNID